MPDAATSALGNGLGEVSSTSPPAAPEGVMIVMDAVENCCAVANLFLCECGLASHENYVKFN